GRVDRAAFAAALATARADAERGALAEARAALVAGLALWHGDAFGELASHDQLAPVAAQAEEERLTATELLADVRIPLGEPATAVADLQLAVAAQPFRERLWELLMTALYRSGRQADALAAYQRCRRLLIDELGIEPGPALQELDEAILLHKAE